MKSGHLKGPPALSGVFWLLVEEQADHTCLRTGTGEKHAGKPIPDQF